MPITKLSFNNKEYKPSARINNVSKIPEWPKVNKTTTGQMRIRLSRYVSIDLAKIEIGRLQIALDIPGKTIIRKTQKHILQNNCEGDIYAIYYMGNLDGSGVFHVSLIGGMIQGQKVRTVAIPLSRAQTIVLGKTIQLFL